MRRRQSRFVPPYKARRQARERQSPAGWAWLKRLRDLAEYEASAAITASLAQLHRSDEVRP